MLAESKLASALSAKHIPKLDALRAISALFVMLFHFGLPVPPGFGVLCFFIISGFLITWLLLAEYETRGRVSLRKFYARRSLRIFPAFYVWWIILTAIVVFRHHANYFGYAISAFFYVSDYYVGLHPLPENGYTLTWSLSVEEQFYVLWPLVFCRLMPNRKRLLKVLATIIVCIWIYRPLLRVLGVNQAYVYNTFECRADAILVGCGLAILLRSGFWPRFWELLCRHWSLLAANMLILGLILSIRLPNSWFRDTVGHAIEPLFIAAILVQLLGIEFRPLRVLDAQPLRYLGQISYSTYLYHGLFPVPHAWPVILRLLPAYALASLSFFLVERPFLRLKDRWFQAPNKVQALQYKEV